MSIESIVALATVLGMLIAFLSALGKAVAFFIKRLDQYIPRPEYELAMGTLTDHYRRLNESIHRTNDLAQKILIEGVKVARVVRDADKGD